MKKFLAIFMFLVCSDASANAASAANGQLLLWFAIIIVISVFARSSSKIGQPFVLGQLIFGVILGIFAHYDLIGLSKMPGDKSIAFFAELGSIFLLLETGLGISFSDIKRTGVYAIMVALMGVLIPFVLGYFIVVPFVLHSSSVYLKIFFGSLLAVTSTGISVSVFKELGILRNSACQIVLAASVIDDVCGLILLSITTGLVLEGGVDLYSIGSTIWGVTIFFIASILFGLYILPWFIKFIGKVNNNSDTVTLVIVAFGLIMSFFANYIGLAFIIGAFLAGLILYPGLFSEFNNIRGQPDFKENHSQLEYLIAPYGKIFTPLFFIYAGMQVDIINNFEIKILIIAVVISLFAILGKLFCGVFLPKNINRWIVGFGMVPRGEIGLIFAMTGLQLNIIGGKIFTAILLMIILTSIVTPISINYLVKRNYPLRSNE